MPLNQILPRQNRLGGGLLFCGLYINPLEQLGLPCSSEDEMSSETFHSLRERGQSRISKWGPVEHNYDAMLIGPTETKHTWAAKYIYLEGVFHVLICSVWDHRTYVIIEYFLQGLLYGQ